MAIYVNYLSFNYSRCYLGPTVHMMTSRLVSECCVCVAVFPVPRTFHALRADPAGSSGHHNGARSDLEDRKQLGELGEFLNNYKYNWENCLHVRPS